MKGFRDRGLVDGAIAEVGHNDVLRASQGSGRRFSPQGKSQLAWLVAAESSRIRSSPSAMDSFKVVKDVRGGYQSCDGCFLEG